MTEDTPDWHQRQYKQEVALRPSQLFPTGKVLWYGDFENEWAGFNISSGTGTYTGISGYSDQGQGSFRLTTGAVIDTELRVYKYFSGVGKGHYGYEMTFATETGMSKFEIRLMTIRNNVRYEARIDIIPSLNEVKYYDSGGNWQDVPGIDRFIDLDATVWQRMKFTMDTEKATYGMFFLANYEIDLSAYALKQSVAGVLERSRFEIAVAPAAALSYRCWIDNIIITDESR